MCSWCSSRTGLAEVEAVDFPLVAATVDRREDLHAALRHAEPEHALEVVRRLAAPRQPSISSITSPKALQPI